MATAWLMPNTQLPSSQYLWKNNAGESGALQTLPRIVCIVITLVKEEKLGERVSHQALDVAAWEGVGLEVQRQSSGEQ